MFFRTEGSLSEGGRSNGIQGDAIQRFTSAFRSYSWITANGQNGVLKWEYRTDYSRASTEPANLNTSDIRYTLDSNLQIRSSNETRSKNRKIRVYKRIA